MLLEILSEEIPARMQIRAASDLQRLLEGALRNAGLAFESVKTYVTPRRLALVAEGLPDRQPDVTEERKGPRADAPKKAISGFLNSVALERDQVEERETDKGLVLFAVMERPGRQTIDVLAEIIPEVICKLSWPKSMRWGSRAMRWIRPLHGIVCLLDGAIVSFEMEDITSGDTTRGHRFLSPEPFEVSGFADYMDKLLQAYVMLDRSKRREMITVGADQLATAEGLKVTKDEALLEEVAGLVEWPVPLLGRIDDAFMDLPPEVMTTSMRVNQKYFALEDAEGNFASHFIVVANIDAADGGEAIVSGNERVLRARLSDAKFFWDQDRKRTLASRAPELAQIIFHARLGTLDGKVDRMQTLAIDLAKNISGADLDRVRSATRLAKADLVTGMVVEFPELQGLMGRYYALNDGENLEVADAIAEHYAPQGPQDRCPSAPVSIAVALADKIDTLVGFYAIDEKPTSSRDPFALRRAALGVIRLILQNSINIKLRDVFERAYSLYDSAAVAGSGASTVAHELMEFIADRLKVHLRDRGIGHDRITAVFALTGEDDLARLLARVNALDEFLAGDDGENLLIAYRRALNIVHIEEKNDGMTYRGRAKNGLLREQPERDLFYALSAAETEISDRLAAEQYVDAMTILSKLRRPVDAFFDDVTVNCDELDLRRNRLLLLSQIGAALESVADFSKIEG